jgi:hypothetical protein
MKLLALCLHRPSESYGDLGFSLVISLDYELVRVYLSARPCKGAVYIKPAPKIFHTRRAAFILLHTATLTRPPLT